MKKSRRTKRSAGSRYLDEVSLAEAYEIRMGSLRELIEIFDTEVKALDSRVHSRLRDDVGYRVIQRLNGVARVHAGVFCAEIGDITQAVCNGCDVFLARDERTIITTHRGWLETRLPTLKVRLPSEILGELAPLLRQ